MKIAIITERADIKLGGAERSVLELRAALSAIGHHVDIIAAKGLATGKNIHILCQGNTAKRTNYFTFEKAIREFLQQNKFDIVHSVLPFEFADVYQPRGGSYAETIVRNAASYQNKIIETYKKVFSVFNSRRTTFLQAERKLSQAINGPVIAALSKYVADQFKEHYGTDSEQISIIPNGVKIKKDTDASQVDKLRTEILAKFNLREADNPVLFLFAANNFRLKGLPSLIQAMQIVSNQQSKRRAYLIVAGSDKNKKCYNMAKAIEPQNILFLGTLSHIQNALAATDIAVLPTFYDPSSRFILEALAAGKPVITTKYNGACDLFVNNRHGKIIDCPEDISSLAEAIAFFTNTKNIHKTSQAIVEDNLQEEISINRVAKQLTELYVKILTKKGTN
ncbi:MAG: glycosyltransferase family 4 protein [Sedimentisphaerales bacterium]|nr:glycosyltransferase family 4 protein [Sedimentisphaerales bacterium]